MIDHVTLNDFKKNISTELIRVISIRHSVRQFRVLDCIA